MSLLLALALEGWLGDPPNRWHPVAWFGRWAAHCERWCYRDARAAGCVAWFAAVAPAWMSAMALHAALGWVGDGLLLWLCLGWRSLFAHVRAVLDAPDLAEARSAVACIVSRDTDAMDVMAARRAALESLAENASDAVVAPLFWFALGGAPAAVLYRAVNTLDAMWGYRSARYRRFGWCAARLDDLANYLPARLTAVMLLLSGQSAAWRKLRTQAHSHASPNAGWPEAALALAADVRLGGPVLRKGCVDARPWYGDASARMPVAAVAQEAVDVVRRALWGAVGCLGMLGYVW
ncbi:MAG: cobalamin biosynthesis protein CobD [Zetaproteobacteria bacterium]|nr:MAG: cobalamin biosynthesis protein CobD [Zetaproteobacteria bacterium]